MRNCIFKVSICLCSFLLLFVSGKAQEKPYREPSGMNNWFVELGGAAFLYSINYEKILYKSRNFGWTGRIGVSYSFSEGRFLNSVELDRDAVLMPFTTSVLLGSRERKEKFEFGGGITLIAKGLSERETVPTAVLGFRVIETNKVCFRVSYTPFIRNSSYVNWFGVSIGRNF